MSLLDTLEAVLAPERLERPPLVLRETRPTSKCIETPVEYRETPLVIRLRDNDHLKILHGSPGSTDGYCNLPDYLIFSEAQLRKKREPILRVLLVEMKSSDGGRAQALRQLHLGVAVTPYLIRLAQIGVGMAPPEIHQCGVVLSPGLPIAKGRTRRGQFEHEPALDPRVGIYIYDVPCGETLFLDEFTYCPS